MICLEDCNDVLELNCRIGKKYPRKCKQGVLCDPESEWDALEKCKICKKII